MKRHTFTLSSDYITLDSLLKLLAFAPSGGAAKMMVAEGLVEVDGELETRKTRKLYAGSVVRVAGEEILVQAP
ncbi:RNA-binding S4 domain-containing protein [Chitinimonas koreensis]|uniref:RNA-binding S4 domain-containing protein n=1 Tax=Chitinimonas koreensis TaxID=356302 RepID=UPI00041ECBAA|nr:RNA-binding S4 domain-containing protein [Chitinimonas koreensis]QNM96965.1 RNA-binding S4 domain-containing protein [Chitinimonas koreensis]